MAIIVFKSSAQTIYALRSCSILFANLFTIGILLTAPASKVWNLYQTLSHCSDLYLTLYVLELVHIYLENPWLENNLIWTNSSGVLYYLVVYLLTDFWLRSLNLLFIFKFFIHSLFVLTYFRSTKWDKFVYEYLYNVLLFGEAVSIYVSMYVLHAYITLIVSFYLSFLCYFSYFSSLNCEICTYFNEKRGKRFLGT